MRCQGFELTNQRRPRLGGSQKAQGYDQAVHLAEGVGVLTLAAEIPTLAPILGIIHGFQ